jgi:menaquinol-cytochrome c reductase iron-sulfur subunit
LNTAGVRLRRLFYWDDESQGVFVAEPALDRRRFLSRTTAALMALMTGVILAPALAFVSSPLRRRGGGSAQRDDFSDAGELKSIPVGTWTLLPIEIVRQDGWDKTRQARSVWVLVSGASAGDIRVLSPICTHLGCPIAWLAATSQFRCPCHGGTFNKDGALIGGPPPRGMDSLESRIRDGHLWVRWQDFLIGVKEQVAVQV